MPRTAFSSRPVPRAAVLEAISCDRINAAEFMQLVGNAPAACGPTDKAPYNAFLVVAEPG